MLTQPVIAPRIGLFYYIRGRSQENSPAATGNLPKASQANLCFLMAPGSQLIGGDLSPSNMEGNTPMSWTTPTLIEVCIGLEINGYMPADGYVPPEF
jgi:coenzyme PQQ precursor peptide PqqA